MASVKTQNSKLVSLM